MSPTSKRWIVVAVTGSLFVFSACTTTTVKKNPSDHDKGIRYYRPKPYLLLQPFKGESKEFVSISLEYLPDFSEEYSIRARAGLGINKTSIKLQDGWNLTEITQELDTQTDENINAVANLLKSVSGFVPSSGPREAMPPAPSMVVRANNVPLGYYESVISPGPDGKKRLYGWRYVGFAPFNACPTVGHGLECTDCRSGAIYGLTLREGVMTFEPLGQVAATALAFGPGSPSQPVPDSLTGELKTAFATGAAGLIKDALTLPLPVPLTSIEVTQRDRVIVFMIPKNLHDALVQAGKLDGVKGGLTSSVQSQLDNSFSAEVIARP